MNYLILGGPRCGKTTYATALQAQTGIPTVRRIDDLVKTLPEWSMVSEAVCEWISEPGPWIIEGVAGARGLRKWLDRHKGLPDCKILCIWAPKVELTKAQANMAKGAATIWQQCLAELKKRGWDADKNLVIEGGLV